jgi:hypothetical protein
MQGKKANSNTTSRSISAGMKSYRHLEIHWKELKTIFDRRTSARIMAQWQQIDGFSRIGSNTWACNRNTEWKHNMHTLSIAPSLYSPRSFAARGLPPAPTQEQAEISDYLLNLQRRLQACELFVCASFSSTRNYSPSNQANSDSPQHPQINCEFKRQHVSPFSGTWPRMTSVSELVWFNGLTI